jgi:hypothetical protein
MRGSWHLPEPAEIKDLCRCAMNTLTSIEGRCKVCSRAKWRVVELIHGEPIEIRDTPQGIEARAARPSWFKRDGKAPKGVVRCPRCKKWGDVDPYPQAPTGGKGFRWILCAECAPYENVPIVGGEN